MRSSEQVYGAKHTELIPIPAELIEQRLAILDARLKDLLSVHYLSRDTMAVAEVQKHLNFWRNINEDT